MKPKTFAVDLAELLHVWNRIETTARAWFAHATEEEIYQITANAMRAQLHNPRRRTT